MSQNLLPHSAFKVSVRGRGLPRLDLPGPNPNPICVTVPLPGPPAAGGVTCFALYTSTRSSTTFEGGCVKSPGSNPNLVRPPPESWDRTDLASQRTRTRRARAAATCGRFSIRYGRIFSPVFPRRLTGQREQKSGRRLPLSCPLESPDRDLKCCTRRRLPGRLSAVRVAERNIIMRSKT